MKSTIKIKKQSKIRATVLGPGTSLNIGHRLGLLLNTPKA
jgi:hypothetical protein